MFASIARRAAPQWKLSIIFAARRFAFKDNLGILKGPIEPFVVRGPKRMGTGPLKNANSHPRLPVVLSIAAALVTLGMKSAAYWLTGSVGLLSDAVESIVNLVAALTAFLCLTYAARPVDPSHT